MDEAPESRHWRMSAVSLLRQAGRTLYPTQTLETLAASGDPDDRASGEDQSHNEEDVVAIQRCEGRREEAEGAGNGVAGMEAAKDEDRASLLASLEP